MTDPCVLIYIRSFGMQCTGNIFIYDLIHHLDRLQTIMFETLKSMFSYIDLQQEEAKEGSSEMKSQVLKSESWLV